ncbi:transcription initiation factor TFIID subunit 6 isoform X1 [Aegilops tauschii subsp. strangulata]|uniref:TATA box binding protein associated factor (TAF) histone-like fold domain-containing protein n=4 Tax=Triticinae TaxID=1648030 RepID=A0A3B5ZM46_WHEAT|nr:transcription initiation factor TFIID subunit 6 isoform X1 [Aegilops tauschii subsp. strangulata]XP_044447589.1 transcription initiation factor TFIID subunit 6-like isoform X1 [Triticum aestivum]XP_044447590.1 transcription initiation factor TFIID subunit 6-like isoform X1 [Triticum aestivum]XP_044447591.1 transcription initiation factor TFIID subunit 6-like isoform X1 [Triticum aestivum]
MSIVPKETIEVIAQSIGIPSLPADVSAALAPDVEYRLREIMQEAIKCMRHAKRTVLTADDVDSALSLRNVEPVYGFASGDPLRFKRAVGHKDLFYIDDREVDFKEIIEAPLPKAPLDTAVVAHWLAIEGVQPAIPENPPIDAIAAPTENKRTEHAKDDGLPVDIKLPVKHILSRELQMYFDKIAELTMSRSSTPVFREALVSLSKDSGLHPLVPYFSYFIADEVTRSLADLPVLFALMRVVQSLLRNPHIHIEPYHITSKRATLVYCQLHQLMPSMITCIVAKRLGHRLSDNHWELRDFSANLVASVCRRYGHVYHNLQIRLTKTLVHAFLDPHKALTQHYGAVQGISALGPSAIRLLLLPNLQTYMQLLDPELQLEKQSNEMKRKEAWRVYGALLCAAGKCLYERLKLFPNLLSPPARPVLRSNSRVATNNPNKRKSSTDLSASQPPLKKMASDVSMSPMGSAAPGAGNMPGSMDGFSAQLPNPSMMQASSSGQKVESMTAAGAIRRDQGNNHAQRVSTVLRQAWKEDQDAGHLLGSLHEVFGEAIFSFIQPPELSIFL